MSDGIAAGDVLVVGGDYGVGRVAAVRWGPKAGEIVVKLEKFTPTAADFPPGRIVTRRADEPDLVAAGGGGDREAGQWKNLEDLRRDLSGVSEDQLEDHVRLDEIADRVGAVEAVALRTSEIGAEIAGRVGELEGLVGGLGARVSVADSRAEAAFLAGERVEKIERVLAALELKSETDGKRVEVVEALASSARPDLAVIDAELRELRERCDRFVARFRAFDRVLEALGEIEIP